MKNKYYSTSKKLNKFCNTFIKEHKQYRLIYMAICDAYGDFLMAFVLKTEQDKSFFIQNYYDECCKNFYNGFLSNGLLRYDVATYKEFEYYVFSREELDSKYEGSVYLAMH